jgi:phosphate transport system substrate-binding protein
MSLINPFLRNTFSLRAGRALVALIFAASLASSCGSEQKKPTDTLTSGTISISVDETYRPVIEQQLKVFDSSFPEAHITPVYKPESECFTDLLEGRAKLILVTRKPLPEELKAYEERKMVTNSVSLARDAVAVIVHPDAADTVLSLPQIRGILTGQYKTPYTVVFDNAGSSTLRYITDSLIPGQKLGPNVYAAKGNDSVVDYVSRNPNAIGFIGLPYVADPRDTKTGAFLTKIRVAAIQNDSTGEFVKPYQAYIALRSYPLTRHLFYVSSENYPGLATGFANFLTNERGQLIFQQAQLFPLKMNIVIREAAINTGGVQTEE